MHQKAMPGQLNFRLKLTIEDTPALCEGQISKLKVEMKPEIAQRDNFGELSQLGRWGKKISERPELQCPSRGT